MQGIPTFKNLEEEGNLAMKGEQNQLTKQEENWDHILSWKPNMENISTVYNVPAGLHNMGLKMEQWIQQYEGYRALKRDALGIVARLQWEEEITHSP